MQNPDKPMQVYHGRFRDNGRCGYVLRPDVMFRKNFDPTKVGELAKNDILPLHLKIDVKSLSLSFCLRFQHFYSLLTSQVIAARHLSRAGNKPILNPFVEVEIYGADFDCHNVRTKKVVGRWNA